MNNFWPVKVLRFVTLFFVFAIALGMWLYPGGNIHDPEQLGYSFTHNFLSDLGGYQSHSNQVNFLSSFLFNLGMFLFVAVGIGFIFVRRLFSQNKVSNILATIGSVFFFIGTVFFAGVGLTPYDLYLELHVFFAVNAFRLLVPGAFLYVLVLFRSKVSNRFALVTMTYLACVIAYVIYQLVAGNPFDSPEEMIRQATIQKLIVIASVICIFSLSFAFQKQIDLLDEATDTGD